MTSMAEAATGIATRQQTAGRHLPRTPRRCIKKKERWLAPALKKERARCVNTELAFVFETQTGDPPVLPTILPWAGGTSGRHLVVPKATTMPKPDTLDVYALMVELNRRYGGRAPGYQRLWSLAISDRIPARREARRWLFERNDIPQIAATLGLTDPPAAA